MKLELHPDRLFPTESSVRAIARRLYQEISDLPIVSPHGHTDPRWFSENKPFKNATDLLITPDHYVFRMLYSLGVSLDQLAIPHADGSCAKVDPRQVWRVFAEYYPAFVGTPSRLWFDHVFQQVFGFEDMLSIETADEYYDKINECLAKPAFSPRCLFDQFNIEVLATTESPLDDLQHHKIIQESDWAGRIITSFRPDSVVDPEHEGFQNNLVTLGNITHEDCFTWQGYLNALMQRREYFKQHGATSSDHGHPTATTANLSDKEKKQLFDKIVELDFTPDEAELFRAQMLTEMAEMSLNDGLVMQIHAGSFRNHNANVFSQYGRDKGADIPTMTNYVHALKPLLDKLGNEAALSIILFTLDEASYSRELAPLAGHYPALKLGPAWWFHDSPEGMRRFRQQTMETAGFYNTVGFNDDTRAFLSIPARHDVARRMDCAFLAELVAEHRMTEQQALRVATDLTYNLVKNAYNL